MVQLLVHPKRRGENMPTSRCDWPGSQGDLPLRVPGIGLYSIVDTAGEQGVPNPAPLTE